MESLGDDYEVAYTEVCNPIKLLSDWKEVLSVYFQYSMVLNSLQNYSL